MGESDSSDLDLELKNHLSGPNSLPLGHTSVKSLSNKFKPDGNGAFKNLLSAQCSSAYLNKKSLPRTKTTTVSDLYT